MDQMDRTMTLAEFELDPRLANDTVPVCEWGLSRVLLMNDRRFPWLILVPRRAGVSEVFDLGEGERSTLWREVDAAAGLLRRETACRKVNIGALGNVVAQLHVHVVARFENDAAWPGPVWGKGTAERYGGEDARMRAAAYKAMLRDPNNS